MISYDKCINIDTVVYCEKRGSNYRVIFMSDDFEYKGICTGERIIGYVGEFTKGRPYLAQTESDFRNSMEFCG